MRGIFVGLGVIALAAAVALAPGSAFGATTVKFFKTPSGKVLCAWVEDGLTFQGDVICEVATGFKPPIPQTGSSCGQIGRFQNQVALRSTGRALAVPCGGTLVGYPNHTFVLRQGKALDDGNGIRCSEATTGLTCRNSSGHGFFLSPQHWHTF